MPNQRIAVTGAGGYLGRHIAALAADGGATVAAVVRPGGSPAPDHDRVQAVAADLGDVAALTSAFAGSDAVTHAAGCMSVEESEARAAILEGTRAVVSACTAAGVGRLVHISSVAVYGDGDFLDATEDQPRRPGNPYGRDQAEAEDLVREAAARGAIDAWILRPNDLYGPGDPNFTRLILSVSTDGLIPLFRGGAIRYDVVSVGDAARAALVAAATPSPLPAPALHVNSGENLTIADFVARIRAHLGLPARTLAVDFLDDLPTEFPRWIAAFLAEHRSFSIAEARALLSWEPRYRFRPSPGLVGTCATETTAEGRRGLRRLAGHFRAILRCSSSTTEAVASGSRLDWHESGSPSHSRSLWHKLPESTRPWPSAPVPGRKDPLSSLFPKADPHRRRTDQRKASAR